MVPSTAQPQASPRAQTMRIVAGIYSLRLLGLSLSVVMVGMVLYRQHVGTAVWSLLVVDGFLWPHLAWLRSSRSKFPMRAEKTHIVVDSLLGGIWVVLMRFNPVPSVVLITMLAMDCMAAGGPKLLLRGLLAQALACALSIAILGFTAVLSTEPLELAACLPLAMSFPLAVGGVTYHLSRRVHQQNQLLAQISRIDGLSNLLNRVHWEEAVSAALKRCRTDRSVASLLMIDIDHFKQINDHFGHLIGDEVIRRVSSVIRSSVRQGDIAGRYGGDEFGVVLTNDSAANAICVAERIRASVNDAIFEEAADLHCTLSIGIAEVSEGMRDTREWMRQADAALYGAKLQGRNQLGCQLLAAS